MAFELKSEIASECGEPTMTALHDQRGEHVLYVANKTAGLTIYNLYSPNSPELIDHVDISELEGLDVMNLDQEGDYLYLALGNHFNNPQAGGLDVVDISGPILKKLFFIMNKN